ncbi:MAG: hypothetical protein QMD65_02395 [Patescibacteria group bacterium]|nr:hypothetical protein [Patescibacteria group bacterium]
MKLFKKDVPITKILKWILIIAVYLNFGWYTGTFFYNHVNYNPSPQTFSEKFMAGGWNIVSSPNTPPSERLGVLFYQVIVPLFWPIGFLMSAFFWVLYFLVEIIIIAVIWKFLICTCIWEFLKFLFWVIFMGGGAELVQNFFAWKYADSALMLTGGLMMFMTISRSKDRGAKISFIVFFIGVGIFLLGAYL